MHRHGKAIPSTPRSEPMRRRHTGASDIPPRSTDAVLRTVQAAPWTWALPEHTVRLTLDGYRHIDFNVYFYVPVPPISLNGTWTLEQDYR